MAEVTPEQMVMVIDQYASLVQNGDYFLGHCPGCHATERMVVRPAIGQWHCYTCGAGGDIIDFLRLAEDSSTATANARLQQLLAESAASPPPSPSPQAPPSAAPTEGNAIFDGLLERLSGVKGFSGASAFTGQTAVNVGAPIDQAAEVMQSLAAMLASARRLLGEAGESFGVVLMRHGNGKLTLIEGELGDRGYSLLLALEPEANEAMVQLMVRSYLSRLNAATAAPAP